MLEKNKQPSKLITFLRKTRPAKTSHPAVGFGVSFAAAIALLTLGGYYLDQKRGGGQALTITGAMLGLLFGAYELWKIVRWSKHDDQ